MIRKHTLTLSALLALALGVAYASAQWSMQPQQSTLTFVGVQAGAEFTGAFERFTADIAFDPEDLGSSRFDVTIDMASVNTKDAERDGIIKGPDLFAVRTHPTARYVAEDFKSLGGGKYTANGQLTMRGVTRPVPLQFTFEEQGGAAWLRGSAALKRLDFGVGQGEWQDTQWVSNDVRIQFALRLNPG